MLSKRSEGALEPGGFVTGFIYFPVLRDGKYGVTFEMTLTDVRTKDQFGTVRIPFVVK